MHKEQIMNEDLERNYEETIAELEKIVELQHLKNEELEIEIEYLNRQLEVCAEAWNQLYDVDYKNDKLLDENERLKLSLMCSKF